MMTLTVAKIVLVVLVGPLLLYVILQTIQAWRFALRTRDVRVRDMAIVLTMLAVFLMLGGMIAYAILSS